MTPPGAGADPGAHGRRHNVPRTPEHRHDVPRSPEHRQGVARPSEPPRGRSRPPEPRRDESRQPHPVASFFRANPQVLVLLVICVVLGLGTFLAVLFGLVTAPTDQTTGEPSGAILGAHTALSGALWPIP